MRIPTYMQPLLALRAAGFPLHVIIAGRPVPPKGDQRGLLVVGDDPLGQPSRGPDAFDCVHLRDWLAGLAPGAVGVFTGDPEASAYAEIALAVPLLPGGAVIIECTESTWPAWPRYVDTHAPHAMRASVVPPGPLAHGAGDAVILRHGATVGASAR